MYVRDIIKQMTYFTMDKGVLRMEKTELYLQIEKFKNLNGKNCEIIVKHALWGVQLFTCEELVLVNDEDRLGVNIGGHNLYVYKPEIVLCGIDNNRYIMADKTVQIEIFVNKM
jgi:hypothetical protein